MKSGPIVALILLCLPVFCVRAGTAQNSNGPAAVSTPASGGAHEAGVKFGLDDLMTLLVQPRHLKLYYAGSRKNWELAAAESRSLSSAFDRITQSIPVYLDIGVGEAIATILKPKVKAVDGAIAAGDAKQFAVTFDDLTAACNACHVYMEHPYIVVKVPEPTSVSTYSDQNFSPSP